MPETMNTPAVTTELRSHLQRGMLAGFKAAKPEAAVANAKPFEDIDADQLKRRAAITTSTKLTPEGKRDALRDLDAEVLASADAAVRPLLAACEANEAACLSELMAVTAPAPLSDWRAVAHELRKQEVRAAVAGLDGPALELVFRQGDATIREALTDRHRIQVLEHGVIKVGPYITDQVREQVALEAAKTRRPDLADRLHDVRLTKDFYKAMHNALVASVRAGRR
jgi:hypothetical protein